MSQSDIICGGAATSRALSIGRGWRGAPGDGTRMRKCAQSAHLFLCSHKAEHFFYESRGEIPRRTPVVSSFPFFPGKERKRSKGKKPPPGQNSPVFRGRRRSALNAYVAEGAKFLIFFSGTCHLRPRDASAPPPSAAPSRSRHRRILHRRASLRQTLRLNEKSNRKQRP